MSMPEVLQKPIHISPRRLAHANIFVSSLERSLAFYNRTCGLEIVLLQPAIKAGFLSNGSTHHDLGMIEVTEAGLMGEEGHRILSPGQGSRPGLYHLGWEMESEFDLVKAYQRATDAGYKIHRTVRHKASHSIYLFDPDGNIHEFYADVARDWRRLYSENLNLSGDWIPGKNRPSTDRRYHDDPEIRRVAAAPIHPVRFSHAALIARHFDRMRAFLTNVVGLFDIACSDEDGIVAYGAPASPDSVVLQLLSQRDTGERQEKGIHYIAFQVADEAEVERGERALADTGIDVARSIETKEKRAVFIRDPDGMLVGFCGPKQGRGDVAGEDALEAFGF